MALKILETFGLFVFFTCLVFSSEGLPFLLFANRKDIRFLDTEVRRKNVSSIIAGHLEDAAALDFYYAGGLIFWADVGLEEIRGMNINDSKSNKSIIATGLISPDGLACDWLGKKLYWTDSETNRIEVSNFDGSHRKVLFWKDLDQPRAIVLVPMDGWMFWTDWGESPKIEKASMDGNRNYRKIIVNDNIFWPNGITADYDLKRIFWADAKLKFISSMDFDGKNRKIVASGNLPHPFALTVYNDMLYWTDWETRAIHSCNRTFGCTKRTTFGGFLSPMGIHIHLQERQPFAHTPCESNNGGCSHLCLVSAYKPYYSCACPTGVRLKDDEKSCADGAEELLLLVRRTDIRRISLDTPDFTDVVLELDGIKHAIAVDYDPVEEYMYWSDDEARAIRRAFLNGTGQENLITTEVHHPDGLSVDWIARNLYWSDTGTDRIEVARLNGSSRKILITENLDEPRAIVLDPSEGYMYWTDWGDSPKIERAALDGSFRSILINTSLGWPNGLSIDYEEKKLYWGDAKTDKIEMANCDGTDRRVLVSDQLPHIFGFTSLGKHIYWTDWQRRSIERVDKITGVMREIIVDQLPDLMGLKAINVKDTHGTNPCAGNNGNCTHLCLNRPKNDYICSCPMGLELSSDNITCVVPEAFLLFSRRDNIRRISLKSNRGDVIPVSGVQEANALDYDINDHRIYWTDTTLKTINRAFVNGSNMEPVIEFGLSYPEGMALDWVAHNLYWTDMGSNRIEVSRLDGSSRKVLLWRHMDDPRSLALDPSEGYMYWSDWASNSRIERASMDGSHRKILISKLGRANGLAIDYVERRLYWIDINALKIESSDLNGNNRNQIISEDLFGPYSLTQYEDFIYWTDWKTNSIERANKTSGKNRTMIQKNLDNVMDILVFHTSRQSGWNQCAVNKGGCSHLCLALPSSIQNKSYTHHCACPTHYSLAPDNKTCRPPVNFMLFSQRNSISRMLLEPIDSPDITLPIHGLKNIRSIGYDPVEHFVYWIDGRTKTIKKGLENGTKVSIVVSNTGETLHPYDFAIDIFSRVMYWSCSQNNIINVTGLNGNGIGTIIGEIDDRPRCITIHAQKGLLFWTNMVYPPEIIKSNMDGHMKKVLFSTDMDRPTSLTVDTQSDLLFWADVGLKQIESSSITGNNRKVLLSGDLLHPLALSIFDKHLYWIDQDQQIIERINKLTGEERQHIQGRMSFLTDLVAVSSIPENAYKSHKCAIKKGGCSHLCIFVNGKKRCACPLDLVLSTDEASCVSPPTCPVNKFRCTSGITCIPDAWRCDGVTECEDMSDEMNCAECKPRQFRCQNGDCIDDKLRCDMVPQCKDYSDELCCQEDLFLCSNTYQCIQSFMLCDGKKDCRDGTDEHRSNCEVLLVQSHTDVETKHLTSYIIGISAAAGTVFFILLITYGCKRKICNDNENLDMSDIMMAANPAIPHITCMGNVYSRAATALPHPNVTVASNNVPQCFNNEKLFDLNHVGGGASSTTSSGTYPQETLNPPPSPVTVHSQHMYGYCCPSHASSSLRSYRHYRSRNRPPPPTPCSTDVCDDSEPYPYRNKYCSPGVELSYDSDPFIPPPPTPRSHCVSDDNYDTLLSCPPSPSTEHSFYNPHPPPPSPMPESDY